MALTRPATPAEVFRAAHGDPKPCECPDENCHCSSRFFHIHSTVCSDCRAGAHWLADWTVA